MRSDRIAGRDKNVFVNIPKFRYSLSTFKGIVYTKSNICFLSALLVYFCKNTYYLEDFKLVQNLPVTLNPTSKDYFNPIIYLL